MFRLSLERADWLRDALITCAHDEKAAGFFCLLLACAIATALAAWLVRRYSPYAWGSGIPHVEAVVSGQLPPAPPRLIPVKVRRRIACHRRWPRLGREGLSVQMGASLAHLVGTMFRRNWPDCRALVAAGAGAGLATAFNAPIAGAVFVLEDGAAVRTSIAIAALAASATAIAVARLLLGDASDFHVNALGYGDAIRPLYFAVGGFAGLLAVLYNRVLLATIEGANWLSLLPPVLRAALVGAAVGAFAWFASDLVGGGDPITQRALAVAPLAVVPAAFLFRFALGAVSYAAGTPGGLFAPLLVLGAQFGLLLAGVCRALLPNLDVQPEGFAVVGMAALFTGVVRAPVTGIVLDTEMTASVTILLPMLS